MRTKFIAFSIAICSISSIQAQQSSAFLRGGVNLANVSISSDGDIDKAKTLTSFQVGVIGDFHIAPFLSFQPGFLLTGKGSKTQSGSTSDNTYFRATSNPIYVEIPANFIFKTPQAPVRFVAGAGPYIAMGVAGKNKVEGKFLGSAFKSEENIEWSNDDPSTLNYEEGAGYGIMRRFDYGLNGMVGLETKSAVFSLHYGLGLAKLQSGSNSTEDDKNKHRVFSMTVGFRL